MEAVAKDLLHLFMILVDVAFELSRSAPVLAVIGIAVYEVALARFRAWSATGKNPSTSDGSR